MPNAMSSVDQASAAITCGTLTSTGTAVDNQVLPNTPCRAVRLMAPTANTPGAQTNTSPVMFGDASVQNDYIAADGSRDQYIQVDNANKVHLKFVTSGDKIEYRIES